MSWRAQKCTYSGRNVRRPRGHCVLSAGAWLALHSTQTMQLAPSGWSLHHALSPQPETTDCLKLECWSARLRTLRASYKSLLPHASRALLPSPLTSQHSLFSHRGDVHHSTRPSLSPTPAQSVVPAELLTCHLAPLRTHSPLPCPTLVRRTTTRTPLLDRAAAGAPRHSTTAVRVATPAQRSAFPESLTPSPLLFSSLLCPCRVCRAGREPLKSLLRWSAHRAGSTASASTRDAAIPAQARALPQAHIALLLLCRLALPATHTALLGRLCVDVCMRRACSVRGSPCVQLEGRSVKECCEDPRTVGGGDSDSGSAAVEAESAAHLSSASSLPAGPCSAEARLFIYCKREQLDARSRMRGNKALR